MGVVSAIISVANKWKILTSDQENRTVRVLPCDVVGRTKFPGYETRGLGCVSFDEACEIARSCRENCSSEKSFVVESARLHSGVVIERIDGGLPEKYLLREDHTLRDPEAGVIVALVTREPVRERTACNATSLRDTSVTRRHVFSFGQCSVVLDYTKGEWLAYCDLN